MGKDEKDNHDEYKLGIPAKSALTKPGERPFSTVIGSEFDRMNKPLAMNMTPKVTMKAGILKGDHTPSSHPNQTAQKHGSEPHPEVAVARRFSA